MVDAFSQREWNVNFDLNEDEEMLKALTERFVSDHYDHDSRRAYLAEADGFSGKNWALLGELGLIAAPFPEELGGLGLDPTGVATVFEALGRGLVVEPLGETVVLAGRLFAQTAPEALLREWIDDLLTGERRLALAHYENEARGGATWIATTARAEGGGFVLDGAKPYCIASGGVDGYIVSARLSGSPQDKDREVGLFLVPANAAGLSAQRWQLADGSVATSVELTDVRVPAGNRLDGNLAAIAEVDELASLARSAEALGIMQRLFGETLDYLRTREQFGSALGSFQAIQHRMVAQYAALEQSRALLNQALVSWGTGDFARAVHGARAYISEASITLGHEMIQFHGGMGVTDELAIGGGHKRLLVLSRWPEAAEVSLDRYAGLLN
jgi:alkylation response protein AidB-like acyl-CoA dehydrogenase